MPGRMSYWLKKRQIHSRSYEARPETLIQLSCWLTIKPPQVMSLWSHHWTVYFHTFPAWPLMSPHHEQCAALVAVMFLFLVRCQSSRFHITPPCPSQDTPQWVTCEYLPSLTVSRTSEHLHPPSVFTFDLHSLHRISIYFFLLCPVLLLERECRRFLQCRFSPRCLMLTLAAG